MHSTIPQTLRSMAGASNEPAPLSKSVLVIIDAQKEYENGALPLVGFQAAVDEIWKLLQRARSAKTPVIHVVHKGKPGSKAFDPNGKFVEIVDLLKPVAGEIIVDKSLPSSFTQTVLEAELQKTGCKDLILVGFMTHMCVSSTTREAAEKGYRCTVVASACATRDLPDGQGGVIEARVLNAANLVALADRFALVVSSGDKI